MNRPICRHCLYSGKINGHYGSLFCDFLTKAGYRRPCKASNNCEAFVPRTKADAKWAETREEKTPKPKLMDKYHDRALELYNAGMFDGDIARKLNVPRNAVATWRRDNFLPAHKKPTAMDGKEEQAMKLYQSGANDRLIAEALGVSIYAVRTWRDKNKLTGTWQRGK